MKEINRNLFFSLVFIFVFLLVPQFESQRGGEELTPLTQKKLRLLLYKRKNIDCPLMLWG